jgi:hypothetical protein
MPNAEATAWSDIRSDIRKILRRAPPRVPAQQRFDFVYDDRARQTTG